MLSTCTEPDCTTLVLGVGACLAHQTASTQEFVRGRPFVDSLVDAEELRAPTAPRVTAATVLVENEP